MWWMAAALGAGGDGQASFGADVTVRDIIDNVRVNETLYENCDVVLNEEYKLLLAPRAFGGGSHETMERKCETRYVLQGGMSRMEVEESYRSAASPDLQQFSRLRLFDGIKSRALEGAIANIVDGPTVDQHIIPPHMMILQNRTYPVPLSTYLQGQEALAAYPGFVWSAAGSRRIEVEYVGEETRDGHPCHKLISQHISTSSP